LIHLIFFFGRKGNEFGDNLKIDYDNMYEKSSEL
jgi:hypothetical protein